MGDKNVIIYTEKRKTIFDEISKRKIVVGGVVATTILIGTISAMNNNKKKVILRPNSSIDSNVKYTLFKESVETINNMQKHFPLQLVNSYNIENNLESKAKTVFKSAFIVESLQHNIEGETVETVVSAIVNYFYFSDDVKTSIKTDDTNTKIVVITPDLSKIRTEVVVQNLVTDMVLPDNETYSALEKRVQEDLTRMYRMDTDDSVQSLVEFYQKEYKFLATDFEVAVQKPAGIGGEVK